MGTPREFLFNPETLELQYFMPGSSRPKGSMNVIAVDHDYYVSCGGMELYVKIIGEDGSYYTLKDCNPGMKWVRAKFRTALRAKTLNAIFSPTANQQQLPSTRSLRKTVCASHLSWHSPDEHQDGTPRFVVFP